LFGVIDLLAAVIVVITACYLCGKLIIATRNKQILVVDEHTPFTVTERDDKSITLRTSLHFHNDGTSCATLLDCFARPQMPYERYDGCAVSAKLEREGVPREDGYFESYIIEHKEAVNMIVYVTLTARKGLTLEEALSHMVSFPVEVIYEESGRTPCEYKKVRVEVMREDIGRAAGIEMAED